MSDEFDNGPDGTDQAEAEVNQDLGPDGLPKSARIEAGRYGYPLPDPVTGKKKNWLRATSFVGKAADQYHLNRWHERCVAKGMGLVPRAAETAARLDVKADKDRLNKAVQLAKAAAGANVASDRGTELHASTESADFAGSWQTPFSILAVEEPDRRQVQLYLDCLALNGLKVAVSPYDGSLMIERVTVSQRYDVAGKFDRILTEPDGTYVLADLKTKDSLDFGAGEIKAQEAVYEDGINNTGVWTGRHYDTSVKVRTDYGLVIWLPQSGNSCEIRKVDLASGHEVARVCAEVRLSQKVRHELTPYEPQQPLSQDVKDQYWLEALNAAHTRDELVQVAARARTFGQWNERLAGQARLLAGAL